MAERVSVTDLAFMKGHRQARRAAARLYRQLLVERAPSLNDMLDARQRIVLQATLELAETTLEANDGADLIAQARKDNS
jgi:hypothetical protein